MSVRRLGGKSGCLVGWVIDHKKGCRIRVSGSQDKSRVTYGLGNNTKSQCVSRVPSMEVEWSVSREIKRKSSEETAEAQAALSQHHILIACAHSQCH